MAEACLTIILNLSAHMQIQLNIFTLCHLSTLKADKIVCVCRHAVNELNHLIAFFVQLALAS